MSEPAITAFISWAHSDVGWDSGETEAWAELVARLASLLCHNGIDCDVDLFHASEPVNWQTYGPERIRTVDHVLVAVNAPWRARYEGRRAVGTGAGVAREANVLKTRFDRDPDAFQRQVKLLLLGPDASADDIPEELGHLAQVSICQVDQQGVVPLLRLLTGQAGWAKPPLGTVPDLPPRAVPSASREPEPVSPDDADDQPRHLDWMDRINEARRALGIREGPLSNLVDSDVESQRLELAALNGMAAGQRSARATAANRAEPLEISPDALGLAGELSAFAGQLEWEDDVAPRVVMLTAVARPVVREFGRLIGPGARELLERVRESAEAASLHERYAPNLSAVQWRRYGADQWIADDRREPPEIKLQAHRDGTLVLASRRAGDSVGTVLVAFEDAIAGLTAGLCAGSGTLLEAAVDAMVEVGVLVRPIAHAVGYRAHQSVYLEPHRYPQSAFTRAIRSPASVLRQEPTRVAMLLVGDLLSSLSWEGIDPFAGDGRPA